MTQDVPDHLKLGYRYHEEMRAIRAQLEAEGYDPKGMEIFFESQRRYIEAHRNDVPFSVRSRQWFEDQKARNPPKGLTDEEREYLRERLAGANHPLAASILAKLCP